MKTHLGRNKLSLKKLIPKFNESIKFVIDLTFFKKGKETKKGKVLLRGTLTSSVQVKDSVNVPIKKEIVPQPIVSDSNKGTNNDVKANDSIPIESQNNEVIKGEVKIAKPPTLFKPYEGKSQTLTLIMDQLEAKELVDTGGMLDKQDPALQIKIGKQVYSTQR